MKDNDPDKIPSKLPTKDITAIFKSATTDLVKKNIPVTARPEKPTLPDLYHENLL